MPRILVIADDLTGAAEIAGIAQQCGLTAVILRDREGIPKDVPGAWVLDTHSRSCLPAAAEDLLAGMLEGLDFGEFDLVYKKIDSVLRGPVATEALFLMRLAGKRNTLMIPANPASGRIIRDGRYYIHGIPVDETAFRNDPEYPRNAARVEEMVIDGPGQVVYSEWPLKLTGSVVNRLIIPGIESIGQLDELSRKLDPELLFLAGGADFFTSLLRTRFHLDQGPYADRGGLTRKGWKEIYLLGSHPAVRKSSEEQLTRLGKNIRYMPADPEPGSSKSTSYAAWRNSLNKYLHDNDQVVISGPRQIRHASQAGHITGVLCEVASGIIAAQEDPLHIYVEGGELASAIFRKMNWNMLKVNEVHGKGIVGLTSTTQRHMIYLKPGSYPWPERFLNPRPNES